MKMILGLAASATLFGSVVLAMSYTTETTHNVPTTCTETVSLVTGKVNYTGCKPV